MKLINFFIKQIKDLKNNPKSIRTKFKTLFNLLIKIIFFPLNVLITILIILLKNIILVRIGFLKTAWVGQMIVMGEIFLIKKLILIFKEVSGKITQKFQELHI